MQVRISGYSGLPFSDNLFERSSPYPVDNVLLQDHSAVVSAKHNVALSLGVGGVKELRRTLLKRRLIASWDETISS